MGSVSGFKSCGLVQLMDVWIDTPVCERTLVVNCKVLFCILGITFTSDAWILI